jgi:hypothetical protein
MVAAFKRAVADNPSPANVFATINRGIAESERAGRPVSRKRRVLLYAIALVPIILAIGVVIWRITHGFRRHY